MRKLYKIKSENPCKYFSVERIGFQDPLCDLPPFLAKRPKYFSVERIGFQDPLCDLPPF
jgi:hypothetical protein